MELEHEAYKFKISEKEYESLREEIIQRIILINTQANNTLYNLFPEAFIFFL